MADCRLARVAFSGWEKQARPIPSHEVGWIRQVREEWFTRPKAEHIINTLFPFIVKSLKGQEDINSEFRKKSQGYGGGGGDYMGLCEGGIYWL